MGKGPSTSYLCAVFLDCFSHFRFINKYNQHINMQHKSPRYLSKWKLQPCNRQLVMVPFKSKKSHAHSPPRYQYRDYLKCLKWLSKFNRSFCTMLVQYNSRIVDIKYASDNESLKLKSLVQLTDITCDCTIVLHPILASLYDADNNFITGDKKSCSYWHLRHMPYCNMRK